MGSLKNKFNNAVNWLFHNNGKAVPENRLRLDDGTPLHSTGLHRLVYDFHKTGALISLPVIGIATDWKAGPLIGVGLGIAFSSLMRVIHLSSINSKGEKCFNTKPDAHSTTDPRLIEDIEKERNTALASLGIQGIFSLGALTSGNPDLGVIVGDYMVLESIRLGAKAYRFNKVLKKDWVIEDAPRPKRAPPPEKTNPKPLPLQVQPLTVPVPASLT